MASTDVRSSTPAHIAAISAVAAVAAGAGDRISTNDLFLFLDLATILAPVRAHDVGGAPGWGSVQIGRRCSRAVRDYLVASRRFDRRTHVQITVRYSHSTYRRYILRTAHN